MLLVEGTFVFECDSISGPLGAHSLKSLRFCFFDSHVSHETIYPLALSKVFRLIGKKYLGDGN